MGAAAVDIANWWDRQKAESEQILGEWVAQNPQWWTIAIATTTSTFMDLGQGFVDVLRFGQGAAKGGWGYAEDGLRLLVLLGPLGRAGASYGRAAHLAIRRLAVQTEGVSGPCTFTAVNHALSIVGGRPRNLFVTAQDAAAALGKPLASFGKNAEGMHKVWSWVDTLIPFLKSQGVRVRPLGVPNSIDDIVRWAANENGVVIFSIRWTRAAGKNKGKAAGHAMIAVRDSLGRVRFSDHGGRLMASLDELAQAGENFKAVDGYRVFAGAGADKAAVLVEGNAIGGALEYSAQLMRGSAFLLSGVTAQETLEEGVDIMFPVAPAAAMRTAAQADAEVLKRSFEAYKARRTTNRTVKLKPLPKGRGAPRIPRAEHLTGVQYRLNYAGFGAGPVDGICGPLTRGAIIRFQTAYRMGVDGIPGPRTQKKLATVCGL